MALLGLIVGSFLNVCIARWPDEQSVIKPRSRCPSCKKSIACYDNIPLLSWIFLKGRCRHCQSSISIIYPLIEILTSCLFVATFFWAVHEGKLSSWSSSTFLVLLACGLLLVAVALVVCLVDFRHLIIPDEISLNLMPLGPLITLLKPELMSQNFFLKALHLAGQENISFSSLVLLRQSQEIPAFLNSLGGLALGGGILYFLSSVGPWFFKKETMGLGDVKLLATLGGFLGMEGVLVTLMTAAICGSVSGIAIWALSGKRHIPFGPWLMLGALGSYFFKAPLICLLFQFTFSFNGLFGL
jgi:leader peptidase (prepilin peptidase)/N-methyltransferase